MSSFDRSSSSSEDEFFDAFSGDESCSDTNSLKNITTTTKQQLNNDNNLIKSNDKFVQPRAPPRKKKIKKVNSFQQNKLQDNQFKLDNLLATNLTNVDDIASIQGDLSVTDVHVANQDRKSVHVNDNRKDLSDDIINKVVEENRLKEQQLNKSNNNVRKNFINKQTTSPQQSTSSTDSSKTDSITTNQLKSQTVINDTIKEDDELNSSNCINPINLHLLKITNEYDEEDDSDADTIDERSSQITDKLTDNFENIPDEQPSSLTKKEPLKSTVKNLKKFGQGFMKSVQKVKNSASSSTSNQSNKETINLDKQYQPYESQDVQQQQQNQFKFKSNRKKETADFEGLKIIQELNDCKGAIWCMKWSVCGKLLAVAGKDQLLRVYCCYSAWKYFTALRSNASGGGNQISPNSTKERSFSGSRNSISSLQDNNLSFESVLNNQSFSKFANEDNVLSEEGPLLLFSAYNGHKADVLDIAWSKNHFLLSSSMDKTVLLWHVSRVECLCIFRHIDFVTTIQFHPRDDRYFLSGSLDGKGLWNIPDKRVTLWNEVNALPIPNQRNKNQNTSVPSYGLITASAFVQNGKFAVIGTYDGRVIFYTTDQLKYFTQLHIGSEKQQLSNRIDTLNTDRRGKPKQNFKITGIEGLDENKILVTTNDSRIRLFDLRDLSLACKYKGHTNISSQIKASVSHDNKYIVCGSENSSFYIWKLIQDNTSIGQRRDRNSQWESVRILPNSNSLFSMQNNLNNATSGNKNQSPGIITAATFATMPTILDENAKYVIAVADFNGTIRLFLK